MEVEAAIASLYILLKVGVAASVEINVLACLELVTIYKHRMHQHIYQ